MASSDHRRPKSANPNRRLRTATHKVNDPRVRPGPSDREEEFNYNLNESCPLTVWNTPDSLDDIEEPHQLNRSSASKQQRHTPSPTSSSSTYDSLMTFECIQKASALRVLAKTLDRQRDVLQQAGGTGNGSSTAGESGTNDSRKTTPPPRKLRPLGREYSGSF